MADRRESQWMHEHLMKVREAAARGEGYVEESPNGKRSKLRPGSAGGTISLSLTSMIDVVFQLLIYFLVATDFSMNEQMYRMDLPDRSGGQQMADPFSLDVEPLRVIVGSTGTTREAMTLKVDGPMRQPTSAEDLYSLLWQHQARPDTAGGWYNVDQPIVIVPTEHTRWEHVIEAFNAAHRAGYTNITFGGGT
ncbi:MAG TPA: biopolymer transporter ExbD [Phycisphaerales bacterium]|nr:biopolymer transporter ExbD [Phycisphaerales bacterium]